VNRGITDTASIFWMLICNRAGASNNNPAAA
jgi:hypothetical protein